jgi:WD40 repeat protein
MAFSPDGRTLAIATHNGIVLWDLKTRSAVGNILDNGTTVSDLVFSPDGRTLVSVAQGISLWDVESATQLGQPISRLTSEYTVAFSPNEPVFASVPSGRFEPGPTLLWRGIIWKNTAELGHEVCGLAWGNADEADWIAAAPGVALEHPCPG